MPWTLLQHQWHNNLRHISSHHTHHPLHFTDPEKLEVQTRSHLQDAVDVAATSAAQLVQRAGDLSADGYKAMGADEATCAEKSLEASQEVCIQISMMMQGGPSGSSKNV